MIENIKEGWNIFIIGFILAIALVGGALGSTMRAIDKGETIKIWMVVLEAGCSMFAGGLVTLAMYAMNVGWEWAGVVAGLAGWIGGRATMQRLDKFLEGKKGPLL